MVLHGLRFRRPYPILALIARGGAREGQVCELAQGHGLKDRVIDQVAIESRRGGRKEMVEKAGEKGHGKVLRVEWRKDAPRAGVALSPG